MHCGVVACPYLAQNVLFCVLWFGYALIEPDLFNTVDVPLGCLFVAAV
jgi:hypothetical protein